MRMNIARKLVPDQKSPKRATNVSLSTQLIAEAKELGINISQACEQGLRETIGKTRAEAWLEVNREALQSSNAYVEKHGLPLTKYRQF